MTDHYTKNTKPDAAAYGRYLTGFGVNLLVSDIAATCAFLEKAMCLEVQFADTETAIIRHRGNEFMLHQDATYSDHALSALVGDGAVRGAGAELRLYGVDPDKAARTAMDMGYGTLQPPKDKSHGLREAYVIGPDGYVWVPSLALKA